MGAARYIRLEKAHFGDHNVVITDARGSTVGTLYGDHGDSPDALIAEARRRFPGARVAGAKSRSVRRDRSEARAAGETTFGRLPIGARFEFESALRGQSLVRGPWEKISARKYRDLERGHVHTVGRVGVGVMRVGGAERQVGRARRSSRRRSSRARSCSCSHRTSRRPRRRRVGARNSKIVASSFERYRATAEERRLYGGSTVTKFYVYRKEDERDPSRWVIAKGYGPTPGERKTDAIRRSGLLPDADADEDDEPRCSVAVGHPRSVGGSVRPRSSGFVVIDIRTRMAVSDVFQRRAPARAIARELHERDGIMTGVHQIMLYPGETFDRARPVPR